MNPISGWAGVGASSTPLELQTCLSFRLFIILRVPGWIGGIRVLRTPNRANPAWSSCTTTVAFPPSMMAQCPRADWLRLQRLVRHVFILVTQALHLGAHTSVGHAQSQDSKFAVGCLTCRIQPRTEQILRQYIWRKAGSNRGGLAT
jgi:hypothetical protein